MPPTAVVTGANKGIGYHIARRLLVAGYDVVLACRCPDLAAAAADRLMAEATVQEARAASASSSGGDKDAGGTVPVRTVRFDLEDVPSLAAAAAAVKAMFPDGIDAIVHNAGFAFKFDAKEPFGCQADKTTEINFFNTILASEAFFPVVKDGGRIVFVGSRAGYLRNISGQAAREEFIRKGVTVDHLRKHVASFVVHAKAGTHVDAGWPNTAYGTSKVALGAYVRAFAADGCVVERGIAVNLCCPGWCRTDMAGPDAARSADEGADTPAWLVTAPEVAASSGRFYAEREELDWVGGTWD